MKKFHKLSPNNRFDVSGPDYLTNVDWKNKTHQRAVMSSLLRGTYLYGLETDRKGRVEYAPKWWQFFGFELIQPFYDKEPSTSFGAVFRRTGGTSSNSDAAPTIVIAIRGTVNNHDIGVNAASLFSRLERKNCFKVVLRASESYTGDPNYRGKIWLCGHSLGATIATAVGQELARNRAVFLPTFLFNPPWLLDPTTKNLFAVDLAKAAGALALASMVGGAAGFVFLGSYIAAYRGVKAIVEQNQREKAAEHMFNRMRSWVPRVYVNPHDLWSKNYIRYFQDRKQTAGADLPEKIAFAVLVRTTNGDTGFRESHGLSQWWKKDLRVRSAFYPIRGTGQELNDENRLQDCLA